MAAKQVDECGNTIVVFEPKEFFVAISKKGRKQNFFTHCKGFAYFKFAEIIMAVMLKAELPDNEDAGFAILHVLAEKVMKRVYNMDAPINMNVSTGEYSKALHIADELENGRWK